MCDCCEKIIVQNEIGVPGPEGPPGTPAENAWSLDGNSEGSQKYFGTNDNYDIPLYTNGVQFGLFDTSGNTGLGKTSSLGARLHIKGVDSTSGNFLIKGDDSSNGSLFYVNNAGNTKITPTGTGTIALEINTRSTQDAIITLATNSAASARAKIYVDDTSNFLNFYTVNNDSIFWNGVGLAQVKTLTLFTNNTAKFESNLGIGANPITNYRLVTMGRDLLSSAYAFQALDSGSTNILKSRNDGYNVFRAVNAAILDADLANNELSFYINEAGNSLIFKVKYSTGTVKTTTLALI